MASWPVVPPVLLLEDVSDPEAHVLLLPLLSGSVEVRERVGDGLDLSLLGDLRLLLACETIRD